MSNKTNKILFLFWLLCSSVLSQTITIQRPLAGDGTPVKLLPLKESDEYYLDSNYSITSVPLSLKGLLWLKTYSADYANNSSEYVRFTLLVSFRVYVCFDSRAGKVPDWLSVNFRLTNDRIYVSDNARTLQVWFKDYAAGTYSLGGNMGYGYSGSYNNYVVIFDYKAATTPAILSPSEGTINHPFNPATFYWRQARGATWYHFKLSKTNNSSQIVHSDYGLTDTTITVPGLEPGTVYYWLVRSANELTTSDYTIWTKFTTSTGQAPLSSFQADVISGACPLLVHFGNTSTGNVTSCIWDFGDGSTSSQMNPTHTYENPGEYTVKLTVANAYGSDVMIKSRYIVCNKPADDNLLENEGFETGALFPWKNDNYSGYSQFVIENNGIEGSRLLHVVVGRVGEDWHTRLAQTISVKPSTLYTLSFWARSSASRVIALSLTKDTEPYTWYGFWQEVTLSTDWRQYAFTIVSNSSDISARFSIAMGAQKPDVYLDGFSIKEAGPVTNAKTIITCLTNGKELQISGYRPLPANSRFIFTNYSDPAAFITPTSARVKIPRLPSGEQYKAYRIESDEVNFNATFYTLSGGGHEFQYNSAAELMQVKLITDNSLVQNGGFESGDFLPWAVTDLFHSASSLISTSAAVGKYALQIKPAQTGSANSLKVAQPISVRKDSLYEISFYAQASGSRTLKAAIGSASDPFALYTNPIGFSLATAWQRYDTLLICTANDTAALLSFYLGDNTQTVWLDEVKVTPHKNTITCMFSGNPTQGTGPLQVQFADQSTGPVTRWEWDFGDGTKSYEKNPVHVFFNAGNFEVSLTVSGPNGYDKQVKTGYIKVSESTPNGVMVSVPDTTMVQGSTLLLPIRVSNLTGLDVISFQFTLSYDHSVLQAKKIIVTNSICSYGSQPLYNISQPGKIRVGNFSTASLAGSGNLIFIEFEALALSGARSDIAFDSFLFNAGLPSAQTGNGSVTIKTSTAVTAQDSKPGEFYLGDPYPNPFNNSVHVAVHIPYPGYIRLVVINHLGEEICSLLDGHHSSGRYVVTWGGTSASGGSVASGIYFFKIQSETFQKVTKALLLR